MIANVTKMLDEVHRIYEPGMEHFFGSQTPDMWTRSIDELEASIMDSSKEVVTRAIAIYKYRRMRMVDIYRGFKELAQIGGPPKAMIDPMQKILFADADEQTTRRLVRCDCCQGTPETTGTIKLVPEFRKGEVGEDHAWISSICEQCLKRRGMHGSKTTH
jgi:hypothetical protein